MDAGMMGALVGTSMGVAGGVLGTIACVVTSKRPRERAMVLRAVGMVWALVAFQLGWMLLATGLWKLLALTFPIVLFPAIPLARRAILAGRLEDDAVG